jgi:hypothetical protein
VKVGVRSLFVTYELSQYFVMKHLVLPFCVTVAELKIHVSPFTKLSSMSLVLLYWTAGAYSIKGKWPIRDFVVNHVIK